MNKKSLNRLGYLTRRLTSQTCKGPLTDRERTEYKRLHCMSEFGFLTYCGEEGREKHEWYLERDKKYKEKYGR